jgi:hypothetical protein
LLAHSQLVPLQRGVMNIPHSSPPVFTFDYLLFSNRGGAGGGGKEVYTETAVGKHIAMLV